MGTLHCRTSSTVNTLILRGYVRIVNVHLLVCKTIGDYLKIDLCDDCLEKFGRKNYPEIYDSPDDRVGADTPTPLLTTGENR